VGVREVIAAAASGHRSRQAGAAIALRVLVQYAHAIWCTRTGRTAVNAVLLTPTTGVGAAHGGALPGSAYRRPAQLHKGDIAANKRPALSTALPPDPPIGSSLTSPRTLLMPLIHAQHNRTPIDASRRAEHAGAVGGPR